MTPPEVPRPAKTEHAKLESAQPEAKHRVGGSCRTSRFRDAQRDPCVNFGSRPCNGALSELNRTRKFAARDFFVDCGTMKTDTLFDIAPAK